MGSAAAKTRNWKAWQDLQPGPDKPKLIVIGEVETSNSNQKPSLRRIEPQGINPRILLLELAIDTAGTGNPVMGWREVRYEARIDKDAYSSVDILFGTEVVGHAEVADVQ